MILYSVRDEEDIGGGKRKTAILCAVFHILLALSCAFIFSQSLPSKEASKEISLGVTDFLTPFLEPFVGKGDVTDHLVRKLAHFAEFFVFGTLSAICAILRSRLAAIRKGVNRAVKFQDYLNAAFLSLFIALCDETIQLFTGRGSQVADVWLDFFGALCGIFAFSAVYAAIRRIRRMKKNII